MSNLGKYQEVVTEAKSLGGVENYLKLIEANAVAGAAPRLVARGVALTLAVGGLSGLAFEIRRRIDARRTLTAAAETAREELTIVKPTDGPVDGADHAQADSGTQACAWCGERGQHPPVTPGAVH